MQKSSIKMLLNRIQEFKSGHSPEHIGCIPGVQRQLIIPISISVSANLIYHISGL